MSMHDPGIDVGNPVTSKVLHNVRHEGCVIDVMDYGVAHLKSTRLNNANLEAFLAQPYRATAKHVRWINVSGISWDVISLLARQYELHPLSIEDIYSGEKIARSKVDYYPQHVFLRLLCHLPRRQGGKNCQQDIFLSAGLQGRENTFTSDVMSALSDDSDHEEGRRPPLKAVKTLASVGLAGAQIVGDPAAAQQTWAHDVYPEIGPIDIGKDRLRLREWFKALTPDERERTANTALVEALKRGRRVHITKQHVFVFLRRDGTVISFHGSRLYGLFEPIERRLRKSRSTLRMRPDASMLLHALLDHVVHRSIDLIDDFHEQVLEFERDILIKPEKISVMRDLHIASGDIKLAQATLRPFKNVIRILTKLDVDKCIALADDQKYVRRNKDHVQGYMSREAKVYLTSTMDDVDHILMSLKSHANKTERLLRYAFEMTSNGTRDASKAWTLTFVSFQPLIVLVMYFGMNFNGMLSVQAHTERFFWVICIPVMVAILAFIVWQTRPWRYFRD